MRRHRNDDDPVAPRGVWIAPYTRDNSPVVIAIDSRGRLVGEVLLVPELKASVVSGALGILLQAVDGMPLPLVVKPQGETSLQPDGAANDTL